MTCNKLTSMESLPSEIITDIQRYLTGSSLFNFRVLSKLFAESPIHIDHMVKVYRRRHREKYIHVITLLNDIRYAINPIGKLSHRQIGAEDVFYERIWGTSSTLGAYTNKRPKGEYSEIAQLPFTIRYNGCINRYKFRVHETRDDTVFFHIMRSRINTGCNIKLRIYVELGYV
jgi:hypothetical protein